MHLVGLADHHIVSQKVKSEFVVGAVRDIAFVRLLFGVRTHLRDNHPHGETEEFIKFSHPCGVTCGEIVVDGYDVHAFARKSVEICRKRRNERLTFARAHLCNTTLMQSDTAHKLHVEVAHAEHSFTCLSYERVSIGQDLVKRFPFCKSVFEHLRLSNEGIVVHSGILACQIFDFVCNLVDFAQFEFVFVKKRHISPLCLIFYPISYFLCAHEYAHTTPIFYYTL